MKAELKKGNNKIIWIIAIEVVAIIMLAIGIFIYKSDQKKAVAANLLSEEKMAESKELTITPTIVITPDQLATMTATPTATVTPTTATATSKLNFDDMNQKYGPCVKLNVLMYHHVEEEDVAKSKNQGSLNVTPEYFRKHMQYLKDKNYSVVGMTDLKNFFDNGVSLPKKPILITLDDGYKDNYEQAYPILKEFGYRATIFIPTGLLNNPDYLTWDDLNNMKDLVYFGNHTWSHHSSSGDEAEQNKEISMADQQLSDHGFNTSKIFAYPYGNPSGNAEAVLRKYGYEIAFTTTHGNILCKGQELELPRIRVGNASLNEYGL
jgi:peptidoglycan/xylan/chitin deacetylase (PgdA/CDA1 family)